MVQEEQKRSSNSDGDGRSVKKVRTSKPVQRGLGVETLERIRLEEERKNGVLPVISGHHQYISPPPVLTPRPSQELYAPNLSNVYGHNHMMNSTEFAVSPNLQGVSRPIWPPPPPYYAMQRRHQPHPYQQLPSLVNVPMMNSSSSSSSGGNLQIEPPSNQSHYGNYQLPLWPEQEKMVGMSRWPFCVDNTPIPSFPYHVPPLPPTFNRSNESSMYNYGCGVIPDFEPKKAHFSEGRSSSNPIPVNEREDSSQLKNKENRTLDGNFLTLGLSTQKLKQPPAFSPPTHQGLSESDMSPFRANVKGSTEDPLNHQPGISVQPQPLQGLYPLAGQQVGCSTASRSEAGEKVDLTLKL